MSDKEKKMAKDQPSNDEFKALFGPANTRAPIAGGVEKPPHYSEVRGILKDCGPDLCPYCQRPVAPAIGADEEGQDEFTASVARMEGYDPSFAANRDRPYKPAAPVDHATGCPECPHRVGDITLRDCQHPDCVNGDHAILAKHIEDLRDTARVLRADKFLDGRLNKTAGELDKAADELRPLLAALPPPAPGEGEEAAKWFDDERMAHSQPWDQGCCGCPRCAKYRLAAAALRRGEVTEELESLVKFLLGEDTYKGFWFGEVPAGEKQYWWRKHLRAALKAAWESK